MNLTQNYHKKTLTFASFANAVSTVNPKNFTKVGLDAKFSDTGKFMVLPTYISTISYAAPERITGVEYMAYERGLQEVHCTVSVGAGNDLGCERYCARISQICPKIFMWQTFPLQTFCSSWLLINSHKI